MKQKTIGIIAEYNPFHQGHAYQIDYAKNELGAENVIVVMSGNFTQRGVPAVIDKFERTQLALMHGADMVIELPVCASTASAEIFATTGVNILNATGIVDTLLFGAETPNTKLFNDIASSLLNESFAFKKALNTHLKNGENFAKARAMAIMSTNYFNNDDTLEDFLSSPNNILGIEYVKALLRYNCDMDFALLKRNYDFASSSLIRGNLNMLGPDSIRGAVPSETFDSLNRAFNENRLIFSNDFSLVLHTALISNKDYSVFMDANKDLSSRTANNIDAYIDIKSFAKILKTKNYTLSHTMRFLSHILLNITHEDFALLQSVGFAPYIHILGVRENKKSLLSQIQKASKIPVFANFKDTEGALNGRQMSLYESDLYASDLYRAVTLSISKTLPENERKRKLLIV